MPIVYLIFAILVTFNNLVWYSYHKTQTAEGIQACSKYVSFQLDLADQRLNICKEELYNERTYR